MPFIPHTDDEVRDMLGAIGATSIDELFDEIPPELLIKDLDGVPAAMSEMEISRLMRTRAAEDRGALCFIGAGAYEHHIPTAVIRRTRRKPVRARCKRFTNIRR
jgi:glycine dehydrogenase subunit 1